MGGYPATPILHHWDAASEQHPTPEHTNEDNSLILLPSPRAPFWLMSTVPSAVPWHQYSDLRTMPGLVMRTTSSFRATLHRTLPAIPSLMMTTFHTNPSRRTVTHSSSQFRGENKLFILITGEKNEDSCLYSATHWWAWSYSPTCRGGQ